MKNIFLLMLTLFVFLLLLGITYLIGNRYRRIVIIISVVGIIGTFLLLYFFKK